MSKKKRKGNLLLVVLMAAFIAALLVSLVVAAATSMDRAKRQARNITNIYDELAMADIFARAFVEDIGAQYYQEPVAFGTIDVTYEYYESMFETMDGLSINLDMAALSGGRYLYSGDAGLVLSGIVTESSFDGGVYQPNKISLEERAWNVAKNINTFEIYLPCKIALDFAHTGNVLLGQSGDRYYLQDIEFELVFTSGSSEIYQTYILRDVYAEFTHTGPIKCDIQIDEAELLLIAQTIR